MLLQHRRTDFCLQNTYQSVKVNVSLRRNFIHFFIKYNYMIRNFCYNDCALSLMTLLRCSKIARLNVSYTPTLLGNYFGQKQQKMLLLCKNQSLFESQSSMFA